MDKRKFPQWIKEAVFYEIYPQSVYDSNNDGIGDIPGIIEKLDYIKDLGVNAIWLNPCFESPFTDVKNDEDMQGIRELWQEYRSWLDREYPESVLISEWGSPSTAIQSGFHIYFLLHCGLKGYTHLFRREPYRIPNSPFAGGTSFFDKSGKGDAKVFADEFINELKKINGIGYIGIPTGNHDLGRIAQGRSTEELKTVFAFIFTMPGIPFLYYGDEIGMDYLYGLKSKEGGYNHTGARTPMQWDNTQPNAGFSNASQEKLYLPVNPDKSRPDVTSQLTQEASLLNFTKKLIKIRNSFHALKPYAKFKLLFCEENRSPFVYERISESERLIIGINPYNKPVHAEIPCKCENSVEKVLSSDAAKLKPEQGYTLLSMPSISYGIWIIK